MRTHQPVARTAAASRIEAKNTERGPERPRSAATTLDLAAANPAHVPVHQFATLALDRSSDIPPPPNRTGLPDRLKAGIEHLSGFTMDNVRVHHNSMKPASVHALAYTKGIEIHLGPGQEKHLPHEAWHVVQQKQSRVKPTLQMKGIAINDSPMLEQEAERNGARALRADGARDSDGLRPLRQRLLAAGSAQPLQRYEDTKSGKVSENKLIVVASKKQAYAAQTVIDEANRELKLAGAHGSFVTLQPGADFADDAGVGAAGIKLKAVAPKLDTAAYARRAQAGPPGFQKTLMAAHEIQTVLKTLKDDNAVQVNAQIKQIADRYTLFVKPDAKQDADQEREEKLANLIAALPDDDLALWADCARAAAAVSGSTFAAGQDDRQVLARVPDGLELKGPTAAKGAPHPDSAELSRTVYLHAIHPFLEAAMKERDLASVIDLKRLKVGEHYNVKPAEQPDVKQAAGNAQPADIVFTDPAKTGDTQMALVMYAALTDPGKKAFDRYARINQYAKPLVGQSYTMVTEYNMPGFKEHEDEAKKPWVFHWGGVVMKDGGDDVTLENYSVSDKETVNQDWQFEMYGSTGRQTFHSIHMASELHGNKATTLHVITKDSPPELLVVSAQLATLEQQLVAFVSVEDFEAVKQAMNKVAKLHADEVAGREAGGAAAEDAKAYPQHQAAVAADLKLRLAGAQNIVNWITQLVNLKVGEVAKTPRKTVLAEIQSNLKVRGLAWFAGEGKSRIESLLGSKSSSSGSTGTAVMGTAATGSATGATAAVKK